MLIRLLHLSDLHARGRREADPARRYRVLGPEWKTNLEAIAADGPIDLILFTGDIADHGLRAEHNSTAAFFAQLCSTLKLDRSRLFLVPGNHDVDRSVHAEAWSGLRSALARGADRQAVSRWIAGKADAPLGCEPRWRDQVLERQAGYNEWVSQTLDRPELDSRNHRHGRLGYHIELKLGHPEQPVHVIGLNTAWLAGDNADFEHLLLTEDQLLAAATTEAGAPYSGLRLALMHHPSHYLADDWDVWPMMAGLVDVVFRGHLHRVRLNAWSDPDRRILELAAGCLYDSGAADRYPNNCQIVTLQAAPEGLKVTSRFRAWSPQGGFWYDDNSLYRGTERGWRAWFLPSDSGLLEKDSPIQYLAALRGEADRSTKSSTRLGGTYVAQRAQPLDTGADQVDLETVMRDFWGGDRCRVAVIGNYGTGKTCFAWNTVLEQSDRAEASPDACFPVLFPLRLYIHSSSYFQGNGANLLEQIWAHVKSLGFPTTDQQTFLDRLRRGTIGIVLDGLDELAIPRGARRNGRSTSGSRKIVSRLWEAGPNSFGSSPPIRSFAH
jgi:3',5'-cyclic AMP phosphodiesterase CpdA